MSAPVRLTVAVERWPVRGAFTIARGAKTHVDVVVARLTRGEHAGAGEATPIYYEGETAESVAAEIGALAPEIGGGLERLALQERLGRGAARNALDAAFWALEAAEAGKPVWRIAGLSEPRAIETAFTISLADPARMEGDARAAAAAGHRLLKLKLAGEGDRERVAAVRAGAPAARLIVDANESWTGRDLVAEAAALAALGVELIEQPVARGEDWRLDGIHPPVPFCADESCHTRADIARCRGRYGAINIKLDKAGGLTEALALAAEAKAAGLELMVGCMLSTSLGIAPAFLLAQEARWADLDGPLLVAKDREDGFAFQNGEILPRRGRGTAHGAVEG